jgi:hypothetical protein
MNAARHICEAKSQKAKQIPPPLLLDTRNSTPKRDFTLSSCAADAPVNTSNMLTLTVMALAKGDADIIVSLTAFALIHSAPPEPFRPSCQEGWR